MIKNAQSFSSREAVRFGWDITKKHFWFFVGIVLITSLAPYLPSMVFSWLTENNQNNIFITIIAVCISIIVWIFQLLVEVGFLQIVLKIHDGHKAEFADLFSGAKLILHYLAGSLLYALIVSFGLLLLVVPGIIWGIKFQFYNYLIVDKKLGPIEALKKSSVLTKGIKWRLFKLDLFLSLINILGFLALVVGLVVTIPLAMLATAYVYRKLEHHRNS